jgi:hypothetical protein
MYAYISFRRNLCLLVIGGLMLFSGCSQPLNTTLFDDLDASLQKSINLPPDATVLRSRLVKVNFDLLQSLLPKSGSVEIHEKIKLNLFDDTAYSCIFDRVEPGFPSATIWSGHIENIPNSQVTLVVNGNVLVGNIVLPEKNFQIRYIQEGVHVIYQIDQSRFPAPEEPVSIPPVSYP